MDLSKLSKETLISIIHDQTRVINSFERESGIPLTSPKTPKALPKPNPPSPDTFSLSGQSMNSRDESNKNGPRSTS